MKKERDKSSRLSCDPTRAPCRLEVKSSNRAIQIENLSGKKEVGYQLAFHCATVYLGQFYATRSDFCLFIPECSLNWEVKLLKLRRD